MYFYFRVISLFKKLMNKQSKEHPKCSCINETNGLIRVNVNTNE